MYYEKEYFIHYYNVDYKRRCLIKSIMEYFEDIAILQSESRNIGLSYYKEHQVAWMLYKWDIEILDLPSFGQTVKVTTEPMGLNKFYAFRRYQISDKNHSPLVRANSLWLFFDTKLKRPVRITDDMFNGYGIEKDGGKELEIKEPLGLQRIDQEKKFSVRYSDIDTNMHVNNIKYVEWAMEPVPVDMVINYELRGLRVVYKKEARYGTSIKSVIQIDASNDGVVRCLHSIRTEEGLELATLMSEWRKAPSA